jgi:hypothetical protein
MKWFLDSGLYVIKKKTEACVFHQNDSKENEVVLGNEKVCVLKQMKILGLIFYSIKLSLLLKKQTKQSKPCRLFQNIFLLKKWLNCQLHFFTVDFTMEQRFSFLQPCL